MNVNFRRRKLTVATALSGLVLGLPLALTVSAEGSSSADSQVRTKVQILRVVAPTRADRNELSRLGLDLTARKGGGTIDVVSHGQRDKDALRNAGFTWTVLVEDADAANRARVKADLAYAARPTGPTLPSGRTTYRFLVDYGADMDDLVAAYPTQARSFTLNHDSLEGRDVRALEISNDVHASDGKPTMLLIGLQHAREWPAGEFTMEFAYDLLENSEEPRIANILDKVRVLFVPVVNPDGFRVSRNGIYEMKRKNCRVTDGELPGAGACDLRANKLRGVDQNRNWGRFWGGPGASSFLEDETYAGAAPFSEPETENLQELLSSRQVVTMIDNHTYGGLVLTYPGVSSLPRPPAPDELYMAILAGRMAEQLGGTSGPGYTLYETTGTAADWPYTATGSFAVAIEHKTNGFHPTFKSIIPLYAGGARKVPLGGVRGAYLEAAESTFNTERHSVIEGTAPAGVTLRLTKTFLTFTWLGTSFTDTLDSTMVVPESGSYEWHVNPSTRPEVAADGGTESWTLTCENPAGTVQETVLVTVARGATATENLTCS